MDNMLLEDITGYAKLSLNESAGGATRFSGIFQRANEVNKNKRMYSYDILNSNVEKLSETIKERGLLAELDHPCLTDSNFRVLTENGWKPFVEIRVGDYVWSRADGYMVKSRVNDIIDEPYEGEAYEAKGRSINCTFTPNHRFLLKKQQDHRPDDSELYVTIKDIHNDRTKYRHNLIPKTAKWCGNLNDKFSIRGINRKTKQDYSQEIVFDTEKFVSFLGIYLAEGFLSGTNGINIAQKNEYGMEALRKLLPQLHPDIKWKEYHSGFCATDGRLHDYLVPLGNKFYKYVPQEIKNLSTNYLELLIYWFAIGDGRMSIADSHDGPKRTQKLYEMSDLGTHSRMDVFSVSKRLIDDMHECLVKTGKCGSRAVFMPDKDYMFAGRIIKAENKHPLYRLHISRSKYINLDTRFLKTTQVHHIGRVYCLSTEHGNFYMERDGKSFWTGNSDSIVHLANASHLITKLWWEGNELYGESEILNSPSGKVLKSLIEGGVRVGISSRGVGNGQTDGNGTLIISDNYRLITFDAVADPSTFAAFQAVIKKKHESVNPKTIVDVCQPKPKPNLNHRAFVSYFGAFLDSKINDIKNKN